MLFAQPQKQSILTWIYEDISVQVNWKISADTFTNKQEIKTSLNRKLPDLRVKTYRKHKSIILGHIKDPYYPFSYSGKEQMIRENLLETGNKTIPHDCC